jgi:hypothetical protein
VVDPGVARLLLAEDVVALCQQTRDKRPGKDDHTTSTGVRLGGILEDDLASLALLTGGTSTHALHCLTHSECRVFHSEIQIAPSQTKRLGGTKSKRDRDREQRVHLVFDKRLKKPGCSSAVSSTRFRGSTLQTGLPRDPR